MAREDPQLKLRLTEEMKDMVTAAARENNRSVNAEIVWRIENYEKAKQAWASLDSELNKLESELQERQAEVARLYDERSRLFEAMNNQERSLQTLREALGTLTIMARSLGQAFLSDGDKSEIVKVLALGLADIEVDLSSEASERVPRQPWED
ncbi:Arc family DNA-binding protein [Chelativorans sp. J32]|uniref:Arc family DNA-binding protein n=1 Tax=Chelativorans sp. J32 TaxID=935840 RepID=UPI000480D55E|nr:Arc family DNA-binding protein [Chelativorans sp. J32]